MGTVRFRRVNLRLLVVLAIIAIMATAAYGFAAGNTVADGGKAGDGSGDISGFTVSNIHYTMDTGNPALITGVSFSLDSKATTATVKFAGADNNFGTAYSCDAVGGAPAKDWTCDVSDGALTVLSVEHLDVAAVN